jgi:hypothetical protein
MQNRSATTCALALFLLLALASNDYAQSSSGPPSVSWYWGASLVLWVTQREPSDDCSNPHSVPQAGLACWGVGGAKPGVLATVGGFITPRYGLEFEAALEGSRTGAAMYMLFTDHYSTNRTDATYSHKEYMFSALHRLHFTPGKRRTAIEPVVGFTLAIANDELTNQVGVFYSSWTSQTTTWPYPDAVTRRVASGASTGVDVVTPLGRHVSFVGTARLRWIAWPETIGTDKLPDAVPVRVGRLSFQFGAGLRWGAS